MQIHNLDTLSAQKIILEKNFSVTSFQKYKKQTILMMKEKYQLPHKGIRINQMCVTNSKCKKAWDGTVRHIRKYP